ncbi:hypothetical protein AB0O28_38930 [Microbispora sp. NPDC088329]|uniref:hypothetical protein n=1 Tax=Microbispora sp. NPDC088329 TaxID=3154869 RepID=UPI003412C63F
MGDNRSSRVVVVSARRLAVVAATLIGLAGVVVVPQTLAAPVPAAGHGPHGQGQGQGGQGSKGKEKKGKKGKKGKRHGHGGARLNARLADFGDGPDGGPGGGPGGGHGGGFGGGFGDDGGGGTQRTTGVNTANAPTISSPPYQLATGKRNVNAPAGNSAVDFAGTQQVSSVSVFTDSLSGNCQNGIDNCSINQTLRAEESRSGIGR